MGTPIPTSVGCDEGEVRESTCQVLTLINVYQIVVVMIIVVVSETQRRDSPSRTQESYPEDGGFKKNSLIGASTEG